MICYGGERVTLTAGAPEVFTIGVSLGRIMRFAGHTHAPLPYSVLGHSLTVAALMPPESGIYGLMHDSQESLFSDVPTPMKSQVARSREGRVQNRIYITLGIPEPDDEIIDLVDEADHTALIAEAHILGHPGAAAQWGTEYDDLAAMLTKKHLKKTIDWLDPAKSGSKFEREFKKYMGLAGFDKLEPWN